MVITLLRVIRSSSLHKFDWLKDVEVWSSISQPVGVLGKILGEGEAGPSSFGWQQRLSEITIEPIKNWGPGQDLGDLCPLAPT